MPTISDLRLQAATIKNATQVGENTATRVGTTFETIADLLEQQGVGQDVPSVDLSQLNILRTPADQTTANPTIYNVTTLHNLSSTTIKVGTLFIFSDGGRAVVTQILLSNYQVDGGGNISSPNTSQITMYYRMFNIVNETWSAWTLYGGGGGGGTIDPYPVSGSSNAVESNGVFEGLQKAAPEVDINDIDDLDDYVNMQTGEASTYTIKAYHNLSSTWLRVGILMVFANQAQNTLTQICISNCMVDGGGNLIPNYTTNAMNVFYRFKQFSGNPPEGMTIGVWTTWAKFGDSGYQPDNEDIDLNASDQLQFANKLHDASAFSGLGRVYLRKNIVTSGGVEKNVLTQAMINTANTIYHIQYDYDLNGQTVTLPANVTLQFDGGSLKNGTLNLADTSIKADRVIFGDNLTITGKCLQVASPEWFAGSDADKIEKAIDIFSVVRLAARDYLVDRAINIQHSFRLDGSSIPSNFGDYAGSTTNDYSATRLIPTGNSVSTILSIVSPSARYVSAVVSGVSFIITGTGASAAKSVDGITFSTPGGPSRPFVLENCNMKNLRYGFYVHQGASTASTNIDELYITGCNISNNVEGVHIEGKHAAGTFIITNNVIEQNDNYGIYIGTTGDTTEGTLFGFGRITGNLMEGQSNPIYVEMQRSNLIIEGNYYERSTGSTITIKGVYLGRRFQNVTIKDNVSSSNIGTGISYELTNISVDMTITGKNSVSLTNCIVKNVEGGNITNLHRTISYVNGAALVSNVAEMKFTPNYIYENGIVLLKKSALKTATYVLQDALPAGDYILAYLSDSSKLNELRIGSDTIFNQITVADGYETMAFRYATFTLSASVSAGTTITIYFAANDTGAKSTAYIFPVGTGISGLPFVDIQNTKMPDYVNVVNPVVGFTYTDTAIDKLLVITDIVGGAAVWKDAQGFSPAIKGGLTQNRPTTLGVDDGGFPYFDEGLQKNIIYGRKMIENTIGNVSDGSSYKSNTIPNGTLIQIRASQMNANSNIRVIFAKTNTSTDDGIEVEFKERVTGSSVSKNMVYFKEMIAPDPAVYPYIWIYTQYTGWTFFRWNELVYRFENPDGYVATSIKGATTDRPTGTGGGGVLDSRFDIGFEFFDITLGKPVYASAIAVDGTVTWVDATGAAV